MMRKWMIFACGLFLFGCGTSAAERNNAGNRLSRQGNFGSALRAYQAAQVIEPDNALVYFNAANALADSNELEQAIAALQQAIARGDAPLIAAAYYNLGNIHFETGDYEAAIEAYRESLRNNPNNDDARYNLELANANRLQATPTAIEMQTNPEQQQANPTVPPTPNPGGQELPTPTPTPPESLPDPGPSPMFVGDDESGEASDENRPTPVPRSEGEMSVEEAERLLEPVEADQERSSTFRDNYNLQGTLETDKDW